MLSLNMPSAFAGYQVFESTAAVTQREVPIEKNWVQKVIEWNPCNPRMPDVEIITEPTSYVVGNDKLICHPSIVKKLKEMQS